MVSLVCIVDTYECLYLGLNSMHICRVIYFSNILGTCTGSSLSLEYRHILRGFSWCLLETYMWRDSLNKFYMCMYWGNIWSILQAHMRGHPLVSVSYTYGVIFLGALYQHWVWGKLIWTIDGKIIVGKTLSTHWRTSWCIITGHWPVWLMHIFCSCSSVKENPNSVAG